MRARGKGEKRFTYTTVTTPQIGLSSCCSLYLTPEEWLGSRPTVLIVDEFEEEDDAGVQRKQLPSNPERFNRFPCVLGSVGYTSGTHIWDVDVGDSTFWMLGVTTESVQRKGATSLPREVWCVGYDGNTLSLKAPQESCIPFLGCKKPKRVRVKLNLDKGRLSFTDPFSDTLYYTFTTDFMEKVFPFFCNMCSISPLRIVPVV